LALAADACLGQTAFGTADMRDGNMPSRTALFSRLRWHGLGGVDAAECEVIAGVAAYDSASADTMVIRKPIHMLVSIGLK